MPPSASGPPVPPPGCPAHATGTLPEPPPLTSDRTSLFAPEFSSDPGATYRRLRAAGAVVPVDLFPGVPAWLVVGYQAALEVLRNTDTFSKDSRRWRALNGGEIPLDSPAVPLIAWQPHAMYNDGEEHHRLRQPLTESLARVDPTVLRDSVRRKADTLIDQFATAGEADLVRQYVQALPVLVFGELCGAPEELGDRILDACFRLGNAEGDARVALADAMVCMRELIALKRRDPGADVTSWMLDHPSNLVDEEIEHSLRVFLALGGCLLQILMVSSLRLVLCDNRFAGHLSGGQPARRRRHRRDPVDRPAAGQPGRALPRTRRGVPRRPAA